MTWQRIDDDTYIDDTLVTCAEYQLFIDEMREQGKYYQPDHWTSYQFPEGKAREPIVGVRHSDAVTFCKWLTKRENNNWFYRLPKKQETAGFPTRNLNKSPLGYWIAEPTKENRSMGILQKIQLRLVKSPTVFHLPERSEFEWISFTNINIQVLDLDLIPFSYIDRHINKDRQSYIRDRINLFMAISFGEESYNTDERYRADIASSLTANLEERIIGRSPAFEGIRLVKERIK